MKRVNLVFLHLFVLLLVVAPLLVGCSDDEETDDKTPAGTTTAPKPTEGAFELTGTIDEAGSTSVQPLAEMMASAFEKVHPKVKVMISGGGSSAGVKACANGTVDIGAASRDIKITESGLIPYAIARDAVAIAVHTDNPVILREKRHRIPLAGICGRSEGPDPRRG